MSAQARRFCRECGARLGPGAAFCRSCGTAVDGEAVAAPEEPRRQRRGRAVLLVALAALLLGAGAGAAVLLAGGGDSNQETTAETDPATIPESTTTPTRTEEATAAAEPPAAAVGTIGAGDYVQAGSFRTLAGAEAERERLEAEGVRVIVVESDQAQELYPGFQVLLAGPFTGAGAERAALRRLRDQGVPSAFTRALSPARGITGPEAIAGEWAGELERTGGSQQDLEGPHRVTLSADAEGRTARLDFEDLHCELDLTLSEAGEVSLAYGQEGKCVGEGEWRLRPDGDEISLVLLPPDTEIIVLGTLYRQ